MKKLFSNILVPVDFTAVTLFIVHKAIEMALDYSCDIHLLHVSDGRWSPTLGCSVDDLLEEIEHFRENDRTSQMTALVNFVKMISDGAIQATYSFQEGAWDQTIIETVRRNNCDLVVTGRLQEPNSKKMALDPDRIAAETNVPVITIPYGKGLTHIYSLIIPITDFLPIRKLVYAAYIASKNQASVKLLGLETPTSKDRIRHFLKASYDLIHDTSTAYVSISVTRMQNVAAAENAFARDEATGLILVNPRGQTELPGRFSHNYGLTLSGAASSPVLIVNPI